MEPPSQPPKTAEELDDADTSLLAKSELLTRQEVLKRRMNRLRRLATHYRAHYWLLMEHVRLKHREFYWRYGKSPYVEDEDDDVVVCEEREHGDLGGFGRSNGGVSDDKLGFGKSVSWCMYQGCAAKAMALTRYCVDHIVWDSKQMLYKPCKYPHKRLDEGSYRYLLCNRPILKSTAPSICPTHAKVAKKEIGQALRKGGVPGSLSSKISSKFNFHLVINEYVHLIQSQRRAMASRNTEAIAVDNANT